MWATLVPPFIRPGLLVLLLISAALTSLYAFRWYFMIFSGPAGEAAEGDIHRPRDLMLYPLLALAAGALLLGFLEMPETLGGYHAVTTFLDPVFGPAQLRYGLAVGSAFGSQEAAHSAEITLQAVSGALALLGFLLAYQIYVFRPRWAARLADSSTGTAMATILRQGWGADLLYDAVFVRPYKAVSRWLRHEPVDDGLAALTGSLRVTHYLLSLTQSGRLRGYAAGMALGAIVLLLSWLWS